MIEGFASALDSLAGLSTIPVNSPGQTDWGRPLLIGAIALVAFGQWRRPGFSRGFWPVAAAAVSYWLLAAFNFVPGREASASRYVYAGAVFVLLMAAELLRGVALQPQGAAGRGRRRRLRDRPQPGADEGRQRLAEKEQSVYTRSDLGAMEIARDARSRPASPSARSRLTGTASLGIVEAGKYFEAVDRWGSPAYIAGASSKRRRQAGRHYADIVLSQALPISTGTISATTRLPSARGCVELAATVERRAAARCGCRQGSTRIEVAPGPHAGLDLRRFATGEYPVATEGADGGSIDPAADPARPGAPALVPARRSEPAGPRLPLGRSQTARGPRRSAAPRG